MNQQSSKPSPAVSSESALPASVNLAKAMVTAAYCGLLLLFTVDSIVIIFQGAPLAVALFLWLFRLIPLLIFLPGLRRNSLRAGAWLSFAVLLYFIHAVITAFLPGELFYGLLYSGLCALLFCALVSWIYLGRKHGMVL